MTYPRYSYVEYDDGTIMLDTGEVLPPEPEEDAPEVEE